MEQRRNDPCPCGSGRKYKKCCGDTAAARPAQDLLGQAADLVRRGELPAAAELFAGSEQAVNNGAETFYRLAVALKKRGLAPEAGECYRQALSLHPDYVEALNNLGVILQERREYPEAAELLERARRLRPNAAIGHYNLGVVLVELDRTAEARLCFEETLALQPTYVEAHYNLGLLAREKAAWATAATHFQRAVELRPDYPRTQTELAILAWMNGDFRACSACLEQISRRRATLSPEEQKFIGPYSNFLGKLLTYRQEHGDLYQGGQALPTLYAVGDSHCLAPAHLPVAMGNEIYRVESQIVIGAKAWHLGRQHPNRYQLGLEKIAASIPFGAPVLISFGEIDCRLDEGIIAHHRKSGNDLGQAIPELVTEYVNYLVRLFGIRPTPLLISNVPATGRSTDLVTDEDLRLQAMVVKEFNAALKVACAARHLQVLDVYAATVRPDGLTHGQCHLDTRHLVPALYKHLMEEIPA